MENNIEIQFNFKIPHSLNETKEMFMKTILMFIFVFSCAFLGAATLINETFNGTNLPAGWTFQGPQVGAWSISPTIVAGGSANEARLNNSPGGYGTYRLISPPIDTRKVHDMTLSFRHMFDHYDTQEFATIAVELAHDTESFDWELWYVAPTGDIGPTQVTVPISFDLGMSETTYISLVFRGNNWYISSWYIDDIVLTYNNTLGSGTWTTGTYYPVGDLIIPNGHTLTLQAGTALLLSSDKQLTVQGRLLANGTASQPITFTTPQIRQYWAGIKFDNVNSTNDSSFIFNAIIEYSNDAGIYIDHSNKLRISNSIIRSNSSNAGGGIYCNSSFAIIEGCDFYDNTSTAMGAAIVVSGSTPTVRDNRMYNNTSIGTGGSILHLSACNLSGVYNNQISANYLSTSSNSFGVRTVNATGTFLRNLINNNQAGGLYVYAGSTVSTTVLNCDIGYNGEVGFFNYANTVTLKNTIIWGNGGYAISNYQSWDHINISYCCFDAGSTSNVIPTDISNCVYSNPQFINPTSGSGTPDWSFFKDWGLQLLSPCIDAGDPASPLNPDGSIEDIGMYYRQLKPIITRVADVPNDQGHQVDLNWNRNDIDVAFYPNAFYTVWREGSSRTENVVFITDLAQITQGFDPLGRDICFRDGNRTWYYLQQVWAMNFSEYGWIAPTLLDATISGNNEVNFMVAYHNNNGIWQSIPQSGYSVDNIPPYAPARLTLTPASANQFNLTWDEVTEGVWEGNSYPELNLITYKIYAGDTPYFEISPSSYLMSTTYPFALLNNQTQNKRFYKIVASDSE